MGGLGKGFVLLFFVGWKGGGGGGEGFSGF